MWLSGTGGELEDVGVKKGSGGRSPCRKKAVVFIKQKSQRNGGRELKSQENEQGYKEIS